MCLDLAQAVRRARRWPPAPAGRFPGKPFESLVLGTHGAGWRAPRVALVGAGRGGGLHGRHAAPRRDDRRAGGARSTGSRRVAVLMRAGDGVAPDAAAQALAEGVTAGQLRRRVAQDRRPRPALARRRSRLRASAAAPALTRRVARGVILGESTNRRATLANEPGNRLTPRVFAERGAALAAAAGLGVEVLDETRIAELKMGLLLGVARGSQEPPRLLVLRHEPAGAVSNVTLGLVGKGITFDTGGISIKPAENMDKMKDDMSGGAAVIAAMAAIARLKVPVRCLGVVPMTENMPGGRAIKPGDVLTSAEGKTVEILNTDAEGRLVLGDALWYARQLGATHLVDSPR